LPPARQARDAQAGEAGWLHSARPSSRSVVAYPRTIDRARTGVRRRGAATNRCRFRARACRA